MVIFKKRENEREGFEKVETQEDSDGRLRFLWQCPKCGGSLWVRQPKTKIPILRNFWRGECGGCDSVFGVYVQTHEVPVDLDEVTLSGDYEDIDELCDYLRFRALKEVNPMLMAASKKLKELHERHWDECLQIGKYSNECDILNRCLLNIAESEQNAPETVSDASESDSLPEEENAVGGE